MTSRCVDYLLILVMMATIRYRMLALLEGRSKEQLEGRTKLQQYAGLERMYAGDRDFIRRKQNLIMSAARTTRAPRGFGLYSSPEHSKFSFLLSSKKRYQPRDKDALYITALRDFKHTYLPGGYSRDDMRTPTQHQNRRRKYPGIYQNQRSLDYTDAEARGQGYTPSGDIASYQDVPPSAKAIARDPDVSQKGPLSWIKHAREIFPKLSGIRSRK